MKLGRGTSNCPALEEPLEVTEMGFQMHLSRYQDPGPALATNLWKEGDGWGGMERKVNIGGNGWGDPYTGVIPTAISRWEVAPEIPEGRFWRRRGVPHGIGGFWRQGETEGRFEAGFCRIGEVLYWVCRTENWSL